MILISLTLTACSPAPTEVPLSTVTASPAPANTSTPFQAVAITATSSPFPIPTATLGPTSTPDPFLHYTIPSMRLRAYGGGFIEIIEKLEEKTNFTRYKIRYPSDGLTIYGFMNIPKGEGPFPVIIAIHGYSDPNNYQLMPYSTGAADDFSREGYLVIHPNMRGYGESDSGDDRYRAGLAVDVLNLIALVKAQGSLPGTLEKAIPTHIGIWAHSMGGEIALRVITVNNHDIKATMLYAPMTGNILHNAQLFFNFTALPKFKEELDTPAYLHAAISPVYHYHNITSALKLYHGTADPLIPVEYSRETCEILTSLDKEINCAFYEDAKHTFNSNYTSYFEKSFFYFFKTHLLEP